MRKWKITYETKGSTITIFDCIWYYWLVLQSNIIFFSVSLSNFKIILCKIQSRDWTRTCSWTLNWTWTEPMDKFRFSSSSDIRCSGSVRFPKTAIWACSSSVQVQGSIELELNWTEPRNTTHEYLDYPWVTYYEYKH